MEDSKRVASRAEASNVGSSSRSTKVAGNFVNVAGADRIRSQHLIEAVQKEKRKREELGWDAEQYCV